MKMPNKGDLYEFAGQALVGSAAIPVGLTKSNILYTVNAEFKYIGTGIHTPNPSCECWNYYEPFGFVMDVAVLLRFLKPKNIGGALTLNQLLPYINPFPSPIDYEYAKPIIIYKNNAKCECGIHSIDKSATTKMHSSYCPLSRV